MFIECCNIYFCPVSINGSSKFIEYNDEILVNKYTKEYEQMEQTVINKVCTAENQPNTVKKQQQLYVFFLIILTSEVKWKYGPYMTLY